MLSLSPGRRTCAFFNATATTPKSFEAYSGTLYLIRRTACECAGRQ